MVDDRVEPAIDRSVLASQSIDSITRIVLMSIKCVTIAVCVYFAYLAIETLAGKVTDAQFSLFLSFVTEKRSGQTVLVALLFGISGVLFGFLQHRLRRRTIQDFASYRVQVERIDPLRTSSMLNPSGETHERDR